MTGRRTSLIRGIVTVMAVLLLPVGLGAADHLAETSLVKDRLEAAARDQREDRATLERALASPEAGRLARRMGTDASRVRLGLAALNEAELHALAVRVRQLQSEPLAGFTHDVNELLIIFLIVAIVILVLKAAT